MAQVRTAIIQVSMRWKVGELRYVSGGASDMWRYLKGRSDVIQKNGEPICLSSALPLQWRQQVPLKQYDHSTALHSATCHATQCHMPQDLQTYCYQNFNGDI